MIPISDHPTGASFAVKVHPRARREGISGTIGNALKLELTAPALEGRANEACIRFFAELLQVPRSSVTIASGKTSRLKIVHVSGTSAEQLRQRLTHSKTK